MHGLGAVVRHNLEFIAKREWHLPVTTLVLANSLFYDLQELAIFTGETRLVVTPCSLENAVGSAPQDRVFDLELVRAGDQFVALVSSLSVFLHGSGQAGETGKYMCRPAWEIKAHLTADRPTEG